MSKQEILTILKFHNYILCLDDFSKILRNNNVWVANIYEGLENNMHVKIVIDGEPLKDSITLTDVIKTD